MVLLRGDERFICLEGIVPASGSHRRHALGTQQGFVDAIRSERPAVFAALRQGGDALLQLADLG